MFPLNSIFNKMKSELHTLNRYLVRQLIGCWVSMVALFFLSHAFENFFLEAAGHVAFYVPSVEGQLLKNTPEGSSAGRYFGVALLFVPLMVIALCWKQSAVVRLRFGIARLGLVKWIFVVYVLGIPFLTCFLWVLYAAPFSMPNPPRLLGQHVIHLMMNTSAGLLFFGGILLVVVALMMGMLLSFIWFPIAICLIYIKGEDK